MAPPGQHRAPTTWRVRYTRRFPQQRWVRVTGTPGLPPEGEVGWRNPLKLNMASPPTGKGEKRWWRHSDRRLGARAESRAAVEPPEEQTRPRCRRIRRTGGRGASGRAARRSEVPHRVRCPAASGRTPERAPARPAPSAADPRTAHGPPYLAAWRGRCPSSAARTWTRSPDWTPRPRPGRATPRRGSGCAPPPRPPRPQLQSPFRPRTPAAPAPARRARGPGGGAGRGGAGVRRLGRAGGCGVPRC